LAELTLLNFCILPKDIYKFSVISLKIFLAFFTELEEMVLKLSGKHINTHTNIYTK
jgi:hypothetical protein